MNRWLALAKEASETSKPLPDTPTEPDKRGLCQVLSGCQVEKTENASASDAIEAPRAFAPPEPSQPSRPTPPRPEPDAFPYGHSVDGQPLTWTGKVVSLAEWKRLSEWDKHGSTGKVWNGLTRAWEPRNGGAA